MARKLKALTPERVGDLPDICSRCAFWEMAAPLSPECGSAEDVEMAKEWVRLVASEWGDCGRIVYIDGTAIGYAKYAPGRFFPQARQMAAGPPSVDAVLLACLHVGPEVRDAGLGKVLLQSVLRDLVSRGERVLEAYGAADPLDRRHSPLLSVGFLLKQGFSVTRPHPRYPLMRLELRTLVAWTENLEAVLESLQLPLLKRERVPQPLTGAR